jgi:hypothetical protein
MYNIKPLTYLVHHLELGVDGRMILKLIFEKWLVEVWTGLIWFRIGTGRL